MTKMIRIPLAALVALFTSVLFNSSLAESVLPKAKSVDWPEFIGRQDMKWDRVPKSWLEAPYLGNGMLGLLLFQEDANPKNQEATTDKRALSLHVGRGDYYDNRPPIDGKFKVWTYRSRLPIGFFHVRSKGEVEDADWRLDLWNGKLVGSVKTTEGSYEIESVVHADFDSFYFHVKPDGGEEVAFSWVPQRAESYARKVSEKGKADALRKGKEPTTLQKNFTGEPYPDAPQVVVEESENKGVSRQVLLSESGEQVTTWEILSGEEGAKTLVGSIHFSKELGVSENKANENLKKALGKLKDGSYLPEHRKWWNHFYPQSFVSISDDFWEQFYWIQMYKFASSTRSDGMLLDVMGPWYQPGFWPMVWTDLNVQLTYWTHLTANRLKVGESLVNQMDRYAKNLELNVPKDWRGETINAGTIFPGDLLSPVGKGVPDHLVWMLHNYWLQCSFTDDPEKMRDGLFPLLKKAVNTYLRYLEENPVDLGDGKIHTKYTWSPEYPGGWGMDINYTIALIRWSCKTLLELNEQFDLKDPKADEWRNLFENLVEYQIDETGLKIGKDIPFDKSHRHYSHLLAFYPLFDLTPENERDLLKKSVDHWLAVNQDIANKKDEAMSVTGYTCTGAASMYAVLGDGDTALDYLRMLPFTNVSSTTMYSEGNPVIESPFSAATAIHDMLLQSWGGKIRIMPAIPSSWKSIAFQSLLCQGGAEVSADRTDGKIMHFTISSPKREREIVFHADIANPAFEIVGADGDSKKVELKADTEGFWKVTLAADEQLFAVAEGENLKALDPVKSSPDNSNIFGANDFYSEVIEAYRK